MKTTAIACAVLTGSFGLSSVASAQQWDRGERGEHRAEHRHERNEARHDERQDHRGERQDWNRGYRQPHYSYNQPQYQYRQPHYVYSQPSYRSAQRFYRGSYLPHEYRQRGYYVSNWHAYPGLYAPAYGQQWVNVDGQFLLVAIASGLIANALLN
jgi:Ni/Co efflux regulator RcnB